MQLSQSPRDPTSFWTLPAAFELKNIMMRPAHDCRVRHRQAAFGHHLDQDSEAEFEAQVPPHAQHGDLALEAATLK
jgi:hypothetical protein